jgi:hypothetical protein
MSTPNAVSYAGATFSLLMCLGTTATCLYTLLGTKLPLLMPVATGGIALISGIMVVKDWSRVWWPLLSGKR